jgi:tRNA A37 threonylcarbamoyladenosine dehydratase
MNAPALPVMQADLERRFGALRRLYGALGYASVRAARVCVVGVGGVGSWVAEALARSGVASLTLIDMDHVAESNINRQIQAVTPTLGAAKVEALRERIAEIHPGCVVHAVGEFVSPGNWPALLPAPVDAVIDACDQTQAKLALAQWALTQPRVAFITVGAAGGKQRAQDVCVEDLAAATHDPLLASLRQRLRKLGAPRSGPMRLRCVFSREPVVRPAAEGAGCDIEHTLNCHGYGSSVTVTATFGMVAAGEAVQQIMGMRG